MDLAEDATCRFYQGGQEILIHLLCHCDDLVWTRCLRLENPKTKSCIKEPLSKMMSLITGIKLDSKDRDETDSLYQPNSIRLSLEDLKEYSAA